MEAFLRPFAGIIGIAAYLLLIAGIIKSKVRQSFVAFLLWAMLDAIATITTILKEGNYWLSLSNALGAAIVAILLALKKQVSWTWVETTTTILVIICLNVWYFAGATEGIIVSSLAMVIASVPQMRDTYKTPEETPTTVYSMFLAANILSLIGGKEWTIEDRFYSGCAVFLCAVIVIFSLKNTLKIKQRQPS
ncbi:hypothetical protein [Mucilaginibacter pocheonensis]|uniref:Integral membrane protein n=1 Tax=Mucilaginibacter pocheonensis TaxID=398050 RepID=A0ABU1T4L1_9SPHI|nr:hypothetical protein [Mucilaginibacter pocheonensis]MDR6940326.1 hypothetical protein [Mucilaginibacter pocheonensis]